MKYFDIAFGSSGDLTTVPDGVQVDGSVSYTQGYPIAYSTPVGSGGINIERAKMNQLFNDITLVLQQFQQHGVPPYFAAITADTGYAKYAEVLYTDGIVYQSQINFNTSVPGADANWIAIPLGNFSGVTTGDAKITYKTTADAGWILVNDGSIGNGASGASTRANADTAALFSLLWTNISNTYAPVSGGRGGSAAADFAANKTLTVPLALGRALAVSGSGSGLTARTLGQVLGEELHALITAELASHNHTATPTDSGHFHPLWSDNGGLSGSFVGGLADAGVTIVAGGIGQGSGSYVSNTATGSHQVSQTTTTGVTVAISNTGSGTGHNNMQPSTFVNFMIKL